MRDPRLDIPAPSSPNFDARMREAMQTYLGRTGSPLDKGLTVRDLRELGFIKFVPGAGGQPLQPALPGALLPPRAEPDVPDLTPPPTPTGFALASGITNVLVDHDRPIYSEGRGHDRTVLYGAKRNVSDPVPTFADAVRLADFQGQVYAYPTDPATIWHMWIKWRTVDQVESVVPAGGVNGVSVRTGEDVQALLDILSGQITEGLLYSALGARINMIDGPESVAGSVNARVQAAAAAAQAQVDAVNARLQTAQGALQGQIDAVNAQLAEVTGADEHVSGSAYAEGVVVKSGGKLYRARVAVPAGVQITNTTYWELVGEYASIGEAVAAHAVQLSTHATKISTVEGGLAAEATARNTLAAQLRGTYTGTDVAAVTQGLVFSERQARVAADSANATLVQGVRADLTAAQGTVAGHATAIGTLNTSTSNLDGRVTAQAGRTDVVEAAVATKNRTYRQNAAPAAAGLVAGDLWYDADDGNKAYRWSGTAWALTDDTRIAASAAAITAEQTARANGDSAEATARNTLAANITGSSGENLILNPGFSANGYRLAEATAFASTTYAASGDEGVPALAPCSVVMVREKLAASDATRRSITMRLANNTTRMTARQGDALDISAWIAVTGGVANSARLFVVSRNAAGTSLGTATAFTYDNSAGGWQKLVSTHVMPANSATFEVLVALEAVAPQGMKMFVGELEVRKRGAEGSAMAAAVEAEASVRAAVDGYLGAQQTVRIDVAGHAAGYGLAGSTPDGSGASATSQFGVRANQFFVAPPAVAQAAAPTANLYDGYVWVDTSVSPNVTRYRSGTAWTTTAPALPFTIQATPTTINGVAVPAGVYMRDVFVMNGTITNAKMANLSVDDAKIANLKVSKLIAGAMVVGQYINSSNYVAGTSGWSINAAGNAEFQNATVRGTVYASAGSIGGISIAAGAVRSSNYAANSAGFSLGSDGSAHFNNVRTRGAIMGGAYTAYSWPAANAQGFYLGAEGLRFGSSAGSRYFQVDNDGDVYAPQFSVVGGVASFSGALSAASGTFKGDLSAAGGTFEGVLTAAAINAVDTVNVRGEAIVGIRYASSGPVNSAGAAATQGITMPAGSSGVAIHATIHVSLASPSDGSGGSVFVEIVKNSNGQTIASASASYANGYALNIQIPLSFTAFDPSPIVGWNSYSVKSSGGSSQSSITLTAAKR